MKWIFYFFSAVFALCGVYPLLSFVENIRDYHYFEFRALNVIVGSLFAAWLFFWIGKSFAPPEKVKVEFESGVRQRGYKIAMWGMLVLLIIIAIIETAGLTAVVIKLFRY